MDALTMAAVVVSQVFTRNSNDPRVVEFDWRISTSPGFSWVLKSVAVPTAGEVSWGRRS